MEGIHLYTRGLRVGCDWHTRGACDCLPRPHPPAPPLSRPPPPPSPTTQVCGETTCTENHILELGRLGLRRLNRGGLEERVPPQAIEREVRGLRGPTRRAPDGDDREGACRSLGVIRARERANHEPDVLEEDIGGGLVEGLAALDLAVGDELLHV